MAAAGAERRYALDTNLYIAAYRDLAAQAALEAFQQAFAPFCYLPAIVAQELLAGVRTPAERRLLEKHLLDVFDRRGRIVAPSATAWTASGTALGQLVQREGLELAKVSKAFGNDLLLALTCREHGLVLVTENARDFARIKKVVPHFDFIPPWPRPR